ncbi:MAG: TatD family hydrolase, partial [Candidatus Helarchaeales archaeon]
MFFDVHNHLCQYKDPEQIVKESKQADIEIFAVSMSLKDCRKTIELGKKHEMVHPFLGLHPMHVAGKKFKHEFLQQFEKLLEQHQDEIRGIGEIGLDKYFFKEKNFERQVEVFEFMLKKAEEKNLGITIHGKDAEQEVFQI